MADVPSDAVVAADEQWEYCSLQMLSRSGPGSNADTATIVYHADVPINLPLPFTNQWDRVIGLLGRGDWELVTSTRTVAEDPRSTSSLTALYFKRRIKAGRAVNEPNLIL